MEPNAPPRLRLIIGGRWSEQEEALLRAVRSRVMEYEEVWVKKMCGSATSRSRVRDLPSWITEPEQVIAHISPIDGTIFNGYSVTSVPRRVRTKRLTCIVVVYSDGVHVERAFRRYRRR